MYLIDTIAFWRYMIDGITLEIYGDYDIVGYG